MFALQASNLYLMILSSTAPQNDNSHLLLLDTSSFSNDENYDVHSDDYNTSESNTSGKYDETAASPAPNDVMSPLSRQLQNLSF